MRSWRLAKQRSAAEACSGIGASLFPGRWNRAGERVVYSSASVALAQLELIVNANAALVARYALFELEFGEELVSEPDQLPRGWERLLAPGWTKLQDIGSAWYQGQKSAVLRVPSAVVPLEYNYILNAAHPDFSQIRIRGPIDFATDPRLSRAPGS